MASDCSLNWLNGSSWVEAVILYVYMINNNTHNVKATRFMNPIDAASYAGITLPIVPQFDLLRYDDVDGVVLTVTGSQEEIPPLTHQMTVLHISHPRLTSMKKNNARCDKYYQTGEQNQNGQTDDLALCGLRTGRSDRLLHGDFKKLTVNWSMWSVESVTGDCWFKSGFDLELVDVKFTRWAGESGWTDASVWTVCMIEAGPSVDALNAGTQSEAANGAWESRRTDAGESQVTMAANAVILTWVGITDVNLTETSGESRWTDARTVVRSTAVHTGSSVLARRAADVKESF